MQQKQSTFMIILLNTLLNIKYIILQLYLVQCYHLNIDYHNSSEALFIIVYYINITTLTHYISHRMIFVSSYTAGGLPCNFNVYYVTLINRNFYNKIGTSLVIISNYFLLLHVNIKFLIKSND